MPRPQGLKIRHRDIIRRMPCKLEVDAALKQDILDCDDRARREIGEFLLALQENPLPADRLLLGGAPDESAFYVELPCGFYISWEIIGNLLHLALRGETDGLVVRILGVALVPPG